MNVKASAVALVLFTAIAAGVPEPATQRAPGAAAPAATAAAPAATRAAQTRYTLTNTIQLAGDGHWAKPFLDAAGKTLYILEFEKTQVIEAATGKALAEFPSAGGPRGMVILPEAGRGFISNGWGKSVAIFDLKKNTALGNVLTGQDSDSILYDPQSKRIFTNSWAERCLVSFAPDIDLKDPKLDAPIKFDGRPVAIVADGQGMIYVPTVDPDEIVVVDTRAMKVAAAWPLDVSPTWISMDRVHSRLFVATRSGVLVMSATDGQEIATIPIKTGVSKTAFADNKIVAATYDAGLTIIGLTPEGNFEAQETLKPASLGLTVNPDNAFEVDPVTGVLYVPQVEPHDSSWQTRPLKLLVLGKK